MSQAICHAEQRFFVKANKPTVTLPPFLTSLFSLAQNQQSTFLKNFYRLLGPVALAGTHQQCTNPVDFFLRRGSLKSARDRLRKAASSRRLEALQTHASPHLQQHLQDILNWNRPSPSLT